MGELGILNVGAGDTKLSFDPNNPQDCIRAARIVRDMLRRGYALLIEVERNGKKVYERAKDFDEKTCEYIIADFDPIEAQKADEESVHEQGQAESEAASEAPASSKGKRRGTRRVKAATTKGVAVARTSGG